MQIGCIECGVSSYPIKITNSLSGARRIANKHPSTWDSEGGDGYVMIVDLEKCKVVTDSPTK